MATKKPPTDVDDAPGGADTDTRPRTLAGKLAAVMRAVGRVPKRGHNDHFNYDYPLEADVADAVRGELASLNVAFLPSVVGETREEIGKNSSGVPVFLTTLELAFTFIDGDTDKEITRAWRGWGVDERDKGGFKAMTGGEKFFLLKAFLIPTGEEPDTDSSGHVVSADYAHEETGRVYVRDVRQRSGTNKETKKPWTKYSVILSTGETVDTFQKAIAEAAKACKENKSAVEIDTAPASNSKFNDTLEAIVPVSFLEDAASAADALPGFDPEEDGY